MKNIHLGKIALFFLLGFLLISCGREINSNYDPHFTEDGYRIVTDSAAPIDSLTKVKFYVEVSGSMNGFFRANQSTEFKRDVWEILTHYKKNSQDVSVLTNEGKIGQRLKMEDFKEKMDQGRFVSNASTKVPIMLQSILSDVDFSKGEAAVLISDMKYSPMGKDAKVLMTHYPTDISDTLRGSEKAICLVCATSVYLDSNGHSSCDSSPYYYLIIGNEGGVAELRDGISILLNNNHAFVDNIESGFNYGMITHGFGIPRNSTQLNSNEPTFIEYAEADETDTCTIYLNVDLSPYRWSLADENSLKRAFKATTLYGSKLMVDIDTIDVKIEGLIRTVTATVRLMVFSMPTESDVIEWTLELPSTDTSFFSPYFGAVEENDCSKSYSIEGFIKGMFYRGFNNQTLEPNYILVSKNS